MNSTDLKPCKCGGIPGVDVAMVHVKMLGNPKYLKFKVHCSKCNTSTICYDTKEKAAKTWNDWGVKTK